MHVRELVMVLRLVVKQISIYGQWVVDCDFALLSRKWAWSVMLNYNCEACQTAVLTIINNNNNNNNNNN